MFRESWSTSGHFSLGYRGMCKENPSDLTHLVRYMLLDVVMIVAPKVVKKICFFHISRLICLSATPYTSTLRK